MAQRLESSALCRGAVRELLEEGSSGREVVVGIQRVEATDAGIRGAIMVKKRRVRVWTCGAKSGGTAVGPRRVFMVWARRAVRLKPVKEGVSTFGGCSNTSGGRKDGVGMEYLRREVRPSP